LDINSRSADKKMSSKTVHYSAGVMIGSGAAYLIWDFLAGWQILTVFVGCLWGSGAPEWLEAPLHGWWGTRLSLIPHRTFTHWMAGWICLTGWVGVRTWQDGSFAWWLGFGFCLSALTHVLMDYRTPMSVPVFHPWRRARSHRGRR